MTSLNFSGSLRLLYLNFYAAAAQMALITGRYLNPSFHYIFLL